MSLENAKSFIQKMQSDSAFAETVKNAADQESRSKILKDNGFIFDNDELTAAIEVSGLDPAVLIAGGKCCGYTCEAEHGPNPNPSMHTMFC